MATRVFKLRRNARSWQDRRVALDLLIPIVVRVAVVVWWSTLCGACLLPPPIEPEAEFGNQAPRVLDSTIFPAPVDMPIELSIQCTQPGQTQTFLLDIFDADDRDTIYWRVFVDYSADPLQFERFAEEIQQPDIRPSEASEDGRRALRAEILGSDARFFAGPNQLTRPHIVEFVVSDRPFSDEPLNARESVVNTAQTTVWQWTVDLNNEPCDIGVAP